MKLSFKSIIAVTATFAACNVTLAQGSGYHILNTFHITSNGGWDYIAVSPVTDNIYVSHATQVNILNKNTGDFFSLLIYNNWFGIFKFKINLISHG